MRKSNSNEYLQQLQKRYFKASAKDKKTILNEFVKTTSYDRQHAGKLLRGNYHYHTGPIKRPRKVIYTFLGRSCFRKGL